MDWRLALAYDEGWQGSGHLRPFPFRTPAEDKMKSSTQRLGLTGFLLAFLWAYPGVSPIGAQGAGPKTTARVSPKPSKAQVAWTPIGPGGGGWLTTISVVDDVAGTVYVGCDVGGIYKSVDHGATWEIKNNGLSIYYVEDIAYDPQQPSTLYAGTRGGVFKSTDGGDLWVSKRVGFPPISDFTFSAPISDILVDPNDSDVLYAGVGVPRAGYEEIEGYAWESAETKGAIYKSVDAGESWTLIQGTGIDSTAMVFSLAIDPNDSNTLYAATSAGVYRSTSAGATWVPINSGLPHLLAMTLVVDPTDSNTLYVTMWATPGSATWQGGVYKSLDGGNTWTPKNNGLRKLIAPDPGFTSNYPIISIDPQNPQVLFVGHTPYTPDPGVFKSLDGGNSWVLVSQSEPPGVNMDLGWIVQHGPFTRCLAIDPNDPGRVFFGSPTHLFRTEDGGVSWDQAYTTAVGGGYWKGNGLETTVVQDIEVDPTNSNNVYAGYWDMGFLKSTDGGNSFKRTLNGMNYDSNTFSIVVDPARPNVVYAATGWWETNQGEVCMSVDYGENWAVLNNGMPDAQIWSLALDVASPTNMRTLYATSYGNGVYRTTDDGQSWLPINNGLGVAGNLQARIICVDPNDSNVLYAGLEALQIETSTSLSTVQGGLFNPNVADFCPIEA